jgi:hypothetical protein
MTRNSAGASLIETIISLAIVGIAGLAFAQLSSNFGNIRKFMQASISYRDFMNELEETLSTADRCMSALSGQVIDPSVPSKNPINVTLKMPKSSGVVGETTNYTSGGKVYYNEDPSSGLRIKTVELLNASTPRNSLTGSPVQDVTIIEGGVEKAAVRYYMNLTVGVERGVEGNNGNPNMGGNFRPRVFGLNVIVDPATNVILRCSSDANLEQACIEAGGTYTTIPKPSCELAPAFGGCVFGGSYGLDDGKCKWGNPAMDPNPKNAVCKCPTGYTKTKVIDFDAGKAKAPNVIELWNCYKCP